jgi:hypothetical protein
MIMDTIRIGRLEDMEIITEKLINPYSIKDDVALGLINMNGCLLLEDAESNIIGGALLAVAINDKGTGSIAKVIGIWGNTKVNIITLSMQISKLVVEVHMSSDCIEYMKVPTKNTGAWHRLDMILESLKGKIYLDKSMYSRSFLDIKKAFTTISDRLDTRIKTSNEWIKGEDREILSTIMGHTFKEHAQGVYSFPFLSKAMCKQLVSKSKGYKYEVNDYEDSPYQMPEVILADKDLELYERMLSLFMTNIPEITNVMYARKTTEIRSVQLAKYSPDTISAGNWHHDEDSDLTLVVSLSDTHEGGGTMIHPYGLDKSITIPQMPAGHALLFRGKHYLHKGLPVTKGERNILVFWTVS